MLNRLVRPTSAIALAVVAGLGLSACGGNDDDESNPGAGPVPAATTPAGAGAPRKKVAAGSPEGVVTRYIEAFSAGDGKAVCALYTPAQRRRVAKAAGSTCASGINTAFQQGGAEDGFNQSLGNLRVASSNVDGKAATVRLIAVQGASGASSGQPLDMKLAKSGKTWRIDRPSGR
ncbi:hypothetical protein AB0L40_12645 [Patulibacter sp. NPDC049589]|uniref:hypothetical protein n=1 Tax=Patulibacter sp. NPDC049589 TaxID=3154731 RepID=UPI003421E6FF